MIARVFAAAGILVLAMCGACSRKQAIVVEPVTAKAVEPPKTVPVQFGEPPRLKEEPR